MVGILSIFYREAMMPVTIKDIAIACQVSRGTVDRALNNRGDISEKTRQRILKRAQEMGYEPHFLAQSLATGRTQTIGLIVFDLHNEFFASIVHAAQAVCQSAEYSLSIMVSNMDIQQEKQCVENLVKRNVDALIISSVIQDPEYVQYLHSLSIPVVAIANPIASTIPYIGIDESGAMASVADYLLDRKYSRFYYVSPPLQYAATHNVSTPIARHQGFTQRITHRSHAVIHTLDRSNYIDILFQNIRSKDAMEKTCIVCSSDVYALRILQAMRTNHLSLPDNWGIMGFDNLDILDYVQPALTTVQYPKDAVGQAAVFNLLSRLNPNRQYAQDTVEHLKCSIVEGETT